MSWRRKNLICWGGLTAGDWQYIGSQGVIQGTYEIFMRIAARHFGGDLAGRFVLTAGLTAAWAARSRWPSTMAKGSDPAASKLTRRASTGGMAIGFLDTQDAFAR